MADTRESKPEPQAPLPPQPEKGQGFMDAPWWRLLLWAAIFIAAVYLLGKLEIF